MPTLSGACIAQTAGRVVWLVKRDDGTRACSYRPVLTRLLRPDNDNSTLDRTNRTVE